MTQSHPDKAKANRRSIPWNVPAKCDGHAYCETPDRYREKPFLAGADVEVGSPERERVGEKNHHFHDRRMISFARLCNRERPSPPQNLTLSS